MKKNALLPSGRSTDALLNSHRSGVLALFGCWACLFWFLLSDPCEVRAQAPRIQGQGTAASGQGNAFAAQADDPSALHYNPAGMTQLHGVQNMFGALLVGGVTNFTSPTGATATGDRGGNLAWPTPGHFYLTANLKDVGISALGDLTVGIGVTVPYGSLTRYPENGPFRTAVTFTTNPLLDIKPTIAYKLNDQLSFGLGADIYTYTGLFGEGHVEKRSVSANGASTELFGKDTAAGFNASLLYTPFRNANGKPLVNVGVVYRSQATLHLDGALLRNGSKVSDGTATFVLPQVITGAIALWPVRDADHEWKLELDVDFVGWKSVRNLDVHCASVCTSTGQKFIPQPQNWLGSYSVMIGTEYKWLRPVSLPDWEVALRAGFTNQQTQMPSDTFDPGIPSSDAFTPAIGLGLLCKENGSFLGLTRCGKLGFGAIKPKSVGLDLSFQTAFYEQRTITNNLNPTVNGTYQSTFYAGGVSIKIAY